MSPWQSFHLLGPHVIIYKVGLIVLALCSSLSYLEKQYKAQRRCYYHQEATVPPWDNHSPRSPGHADPIWIPLAEEEWWYFKVKMFRGRSCSSWYVGPRIQIPTFLILSTQLGHNWVMTMTIWAASRMPYSNLTKMMTKNIANLT